MFRSPGVKRLKYSAHAQAAAREDRYGDLSPFLKPFLDFDYVEIVEVELDLEGQIAKRVVRVRITGELCLVLAVTVDGYVKTVWCNHASDKHTTLNRAKYVQPPAAKVPSTK